LSVQHSRHPREAHRRRDGAESGRFDGFKSRSFNSSVFIVVLVASPKRKQRARRVGVIVTVYLIMVVIILLLVLFVLVEDIGQHPVWFLLFS
jgi:hypothetical protein